MGIINFRINYKFKYNFITGGSYDIGSEFYITRIPNIKVVENKRTIMTGALNKPSGFSIDVDNGWDEDINVDF